MGGQTTPRTRTSPRRLAAGEVRFYRAFVDLQPTPVAILHLPNPRQTPTWTVVARNTAAEKLIGSSLFAYLHLPTLPPSPGQRKGGHEAIYRSVVLTGKSGWLGQIIGSERGRASRIFSLRAYPYPDRCVGVVAEIGGMSEPDVLRRVIQAQEQDRKQFSRELHDSVGQILGTLKWKLAKCRREFIANTRLAGMLDECLRTVKECQDEIRGVSYGLRPPMLDMMGLGPALEWHAKRFATGSNLRIDLAVDPRIGRLGEEVELALFRVFQEALTNVWKHARTDEVQVRLSRNKRFVVLEVKDDGTGIPPYVLRGRAGDAVGAGLVKMRERISEVGGTVQIESDEKGTVVRARVPRPIRT
jgi:signal transduction histidine kinase